MSRGSMWGSVFRILEISYVIFMGFELMVSGFVVL